jgi:hypothetical protein
MALTANSRDGCRQIAKNLTSIHISFQYLRAILVALRAFAEIAADD